jgi:FkbM family methyltransferase
VNSDLDPSRAAELGEPASGDMRASASDVRYAYRLLFGREPDAEGWQGHRRTIAQHEISAFDFARLLMESGEFHARNAAARPLVEVRLDGFSVFVRSEDRDIGREIRETRSYEPHVVAQLRRLLNAGDVFVDVGANIGYFTQLAASVVGATGRVVAIEPLDKNVQLILRSIDRNGFSHVDVHACAISDRIGIVSMLTDAATSNGQAAAGARPAAALAQTRTLDELARSLARVDVVKIDIEGFELAAWRGFREGLARHRPHVLTEFHPHCMTRFASADPGDYLAELFAYSRTVDVIHTHAEAERCVDAQAVIRAWEAFDRTQGGDGTSHLDLLIRSPQ